MTPLFGLAVAIIAGLLAPSRRSAVLAAIVPQLAVTAAQSWYLGSGRGSNPPSETTGSAAYWVVQVVILAIVCGVALGIVAVRTRRGRAAGRSGRSNAVMLVLGTVAAFLVTLGYMFAFDRPAHPGSGDGNLPVTGLVGLGAGLAAIVALAVIVFVRRRSAAIAEPVGH